MAIVWIPPQLRDLTDGRETITVPGATVLELVEALERQYPRIGGRFRNGDEMRAGIAVFVDTQIAPLGLFQPVAEQSEVHFLPAVSGG